MNGRLRHPALQGVAGVGAFVALTWPLLVFERPVYVVASFFLIWSAVIASLFAFARAPDEPGPAFGESSSGDSSRGNGSSDGGKDGGRHARSH